MENCDSENTNINNNIILNDKKENMNQITIINLKSPLLKMIFSFLKEKEKLYIIINNKTLQKKLDVNIETYKKISKRYKIGERNGKGKEYYYHKDNGILFFEGE